MLYLNDDMVQQFVHGYQISIILSHSQDSSFMCCIVHAILCNSPLLVIVKMFQNVHNYVHVYYIFFICLLVLYFFIRTNMISIKHNKQYIGIIAAKPCNFNFWPQLRSQIIIVVGLFLSSTYHFSVVQLPFWIMPEMRECAPMKQCFLLVHGHACCFCCLVFIRFHWKPKLFP